jgi:hypothetical protein
MNKATLWKSLVPITVGRLQVSEDGVVGEITELPV